MQLLGHINMLVIKTCAVAKLIAFKSLDSFPETLEYALPCILSRSALKLLLKIWKFSNYAEYSTYSMPNALHLLYLILSSPY